jgi:hypothetical protein
MLAVLAAFVTAMALVTSSASAHGYRHGASGLGSRSASDPELSPLQPLAGRIERMGETRYASVFAGAQIAAGTIDVYVIPGLDNAFLKAVAKADSAGLPYTVKHVGRSYAAQAATSKWISSHLGTLRKQGISPQWWGPHPSDDAVRVALQSPSASQLSALRAAVAKMRTGRLVKRPLKLAQGTSVTRSTYLNAAAAALNAEAPSPNDIVAYPRLLGPTTTSGFRDDSTPFKGADDIWYTQSNTAECTGNFSVNDASNTSQDYMLTAAHCSGFPPVAGHDFYTCYTIDPSTAHCNYNMGTVTDWYWNNGDDFERMSASNRDYRGYVWNDSTGDYWSVNGYIDPAAGDHLTTDGEADGATYNIYVLQAGAGTCFVEHPEGQPNNTHQVCNAIVLESANPLCAAGDSGGPILQRESDGYHIYAAGIILARAQSAGSYYCDGEAFYRIRSYANVRLIWGN